MARIGGAFYAEREMVRALYAVAVKSDVYYATAPRGMTAEQQAHYELLQVQFAELMRKRAAERQGPR